MGASRSGNIPKYEIITNDLIDRIRKGDYEAGKVFCTEMQIAGEYGVSRITAKRAITDLEQQGLLDRKRGVGSFVSKNAGLLLSGAAPIASLSGRVPVQTAVSVADPGPAAAGSNPPKVIALVIPFDINRGGIYDLVLAVKAGMNELGYLVSIYTTDAASTVERAVQEDANLRLLHSQSISGLIFYPTRDYLHLDELNEFVYRGVPVVVIDKLTSCPYLANVTADNEDGGRQLAAHLMDLGHTKIGFITTGPIETTSSIRDRFAGVLLEERHRGIPFRKEFFKYVNKDVSIPDVQSENSPFVKAVSELRQAGVTAIISENDQVAQLVKLSCRLLGIRIPEDMSICGFDNNEIAMHEDITTIDQNFHGLGEAISRILMDAIRDPAADAQHVKIPVGLVVRESTGPVPADRPL
jgi:GntR family transcriptional regulator of arabinose operon